MLGARFRLAIQKGDLAAVRGLLAAGAQVNETWRNDSFPLQYAARLPSTDVLRELLAEGASVRAIDRYNRSALHEAAEYGGAEPVSVLLAHGAVANGGAEPGVDQPLHCAAAKETVELLLDAGANIEAQGSFGATPLMRAAGMPDPATVHTLLARGADPGAVDEVGCTALHNARTPETVTMLLDRLGDSEVERQDECGYTPLGLAVQCQYADVVAALLARGADPDQRLRFGQEPLLHHASRLGDGATVRALIEGGADVQRRDDQGQIALHVAANAEIGALLLAAGRPTDVHARCASERTPLHRAVPQDGELVELLLANGADPGAADAHRQTPIETAVPTPGAIASLLARGARPDCPDAMLAAVVDRAAGEPGPRPDVVALLGIGARPDARVTETAARRGDADLRTLLIKHGVLADAMRLGPAEQASLPQLAIVVHPTAPEAVTVGADPILVRWRLDANSPRPVAVHAVGEARWDGRTVPRALAVSPDGAQLVAAAGERLEAWSWHDFTQQMITIRPTPRAHLVGVAFDHSGALLAVAAVRAGPLVLDRMGYQLADASELADRYGLAPDAFAGAWPGAAVLIGSRLVSLSDDAGCLTLTGSDVRSNGRLDLRYLYTDDEVGFLREQHYCVGWLGSTADGATVAVWTHAQGRPAHGAVVVVDPEDGSVRWTRHLSVPGEHPGAGACFSPDGRWLAVGLGDRVHWLSVADGSLGAIAVLPAPVHALAWDRTTNGLLAATTAGLHRSPAVDLGSKS